MAAKMQKTRYPGIYRRGGSYVVVWRHKGRQRRAAYRTLAETREAQGRRWHDALRRTAERLRDAAQRRGYRPTLGEAG